LCRIRNKPRDILEVEELVADVEVGEADEEVDEVDDEVDNDVDDEVGELVVLNSH
jgi:hypothetical protein